MIRLIGIEGLGVEVFLSLHGGIVSTIASGDGLAVGSLCGSASRCARLGEVMMDGKEDKVHTGLVLVRSTGLGQ